MHLVVEEMSRKTVLPILGLLLCLVVREAAAIPLQMFSPGDPVIRDLRFLLRERGNSLTSLTPPVSSYEVKLILDHIDEENLSDAGRDAYKRIQRSLHPVMRISERFLSVDAHISVFSCGNGEIVDFADAASFVL
jgi:hypothetical protein